MDMFNINQAHLEDQVYCFDDHDLFHSQNFSIQCHVVNQQEQIGRSIVSSSQSGKKYQYIKIRHQNIKHGRTGKMQEMIQLSDISSKMMYDAAQADKKLLGLMNATVSHEMRNPTNSIYCQSIIQKHLNEKILDLIQNPKIKLK